jgi:DNA-binding transcriptional LysR family regulator
MRYFSELCATLNITQAADNLYISRQGLSKSLRHLEEEVGVALFIRKKEGIELTQKGLLLKECIQKQEQTWEEFYRKIRPRKSKKTERIRIGMHNIPFDYCDKQKIYDFAKENPSISIEILDSSVEDFWDMLSKGKMHLAYSLRPPVDRGLPSIKLCDDSLSILLSADSPLAQYEEIDFCTDLLGQTLLIFDPYIVQVFGSLFQSYGIRYDLIASDRNTLMALLSIGQGVFLIQTSIASRFTVGSICSKALLNPPFNADPYLVYQPSPSPVVLHLMRHILTFHGIEHLAEQLWETYPAESLSD